MRLRSPILAVALSSATLAAHAGSFRFILGTSTSAFDASGSLTTGDALAPGEYLITSISGSARVTLSGPELPLLSLLLPGSFPTPSNGGTFPANDNVLFVTNNAGHPDENGFSFLVSDGAQINLYNDGVGADAILLRSGAASLIGETAALSIIPVVPAPEPCSLTLLCTGLLGGALGLKRRILLAVRSTDLHRVK